MRVVARPQRAPYSIAAIRSSARRTLPRTVCEEEMRMTEVRGPDHDLELRRRRRQRQLLKRSSDRCTAAPASTSFANAFYSPHDDNRTVAQFAHRDPAPGTGLCQLDRELCYELHMDVPQE